METTTTNETTTQQDTPRERFMSFMERKLRREMLRYQVGRQMWCPVCDGLLDVRRATSVDVYRTDGRGDRLINTTAYCSPCWKEVGESRKALVQSSVPGADLRFEETSSRDLR